MLLNQNKSGKFNTFKTYLKEAIFSTTDIYLRRLPKGHEPIFWFALPTDQLLICLHQKQSTSIAYLCTEPFPILIIKIRLWSNLCLYFLFNVLLVFYFINLKCLFAVVVIYKESTPQTMTLQQIKFCQGFTWHKTAVHPLPNQNFWPFKSQINVYPDKPTCPIFRFPLFRCHIASNSCESSWLIANYLF